MTNSTSICGGKQRVLLTNGDHFGTIAAARSYARAGHEVWIADPSRRALATSSKYVSRYLECPPFYRIEEMGRWLIDTGREHPGALLYACGDDLAWIISLNREALSEHFTLYAPPSPTIQQVLDKSSLYEICTKLGIPTPLTLFPHDRASLESACAAFQDAFLIKPKTQVGLPVNQKSQHVVPGPDVAKRYMEYRERFLVGKGLARDRPDFTWPMLQAFNPDAARFTTSVSGFCSEGCDTFMASSSIKVLQYPLRVGVGLCFQSIPLDPQLAEWVRALCFAVGYYGVFEVEFLRRGNEYQLMDFNPRFYGQMQLDISRGMNLPRCVSAAARGEPNLEPGALPAARIGQQNLLRTVMTTQWLAGRITWAERKRWLNFLRPGDQLVVDHVYDPEDPVPARREWLRRLLHYIRYPRSSLRSLFGNA